jgi:hypothetical protein
VPSERSSLPIASGDRIQTFKDGEEHVPFAALRGLAPSGEPVDVRLFEDGSVSVGLGDVTLSPAGVFQVTSTEAPATLADLLALGEGTDAIPENATSVVFTCSSNVRVSDDGVNDPTASFGIPLRRGVLYRYSGDIAALSFFGDAVIDGGFYA